MGNICKDLVTALVILPITAGNYQRRQNGSRYFDGTISSTVFFLIFLAVIIIFTISKNIDHDQEKRMGVVFLLLTTIMVLGVAACVTLGCIIKKHGLALVVSKRREGNITKLQIIFLWIFGIVAGLLSISLIGQQSVCEVYNSIIDGGRFFWNSRLIFNSITMLFLFTEIIFISYFVQYNLRNSTFIRYVLFILLSANVSVWLHSVIIDNELFPDNILEKQFGNSSNILYCIQNGTFGTIINKFKTVSNPCFLEFCLLSVTMLLEMWSPTTTENSSEEEVQTYQELNRLSYSVNDRSTLLEISVDNEDRSSGARPGRTIQQLVTFFVTVVIGLGLDVSYLVCVWFPKNAEILMMMERYHTIITIAMIVANFVGFYCLVHYCKPDRANKPLKVSEYVYLSSVLGILMIHVCEIVSAYYTQGPIAQLNLITYILGIVQIYLQVVFLLHANRCKISNIQTNVHLLDCVLIFLMVINLNIWMSDSFIVEQFSVLKDVEKQILGDIVMNLYYHVLLPTSIFFRFSSALELFATFKMYSKNCTRHVLHCR
ncbi:uncharacterized protein LOC132548069 [Ylistrum balloti]|uniref:uncharacterized protein LOC132548069 n=1 Tax=Ylistrum balloti TaxID=509963 RepID=UPI002905EB10|nr:uncharacterized protein LOC132548069 [Ylistrum balloti]